MTWLHDMTTTIEQWARWHIAFHKIHITSVLSKVKTLTQFSSWERPEMSTSTSTSVKTMYQDGKKTTVKTITITHPDVSRGPSIMQELIVCINRGKRHRRPLWRRKSMTKSMHHSRMTSGGGLSESGRPPGQLRVGGPRTSKRRKGIDHHPSQRIPHLWHPPLLVKMEMG